MIERPGIYKVDAATYHADKLRRELTLSCSVAALMVFASAAHAYAAHSRLGAAEQSESNKAASLGDVAHQILLDDGRGFEVIDPEDYPGKKGSIPTGWTNDTIRAARDKVIGDGKTPILLADFQLAALLTDKAREQIRRTEWADTWDEAEPEMTLVWQDGETWCRCRPDKIYRDKNVVVIFDLKFTGVRTNPVSFPKHMANQAYGFRAEWYRRGASKALGMDLDAIYHVYLPIETSPPYVLTPFMISAGWQAISQRQIEAALLLWRECMARGVWPDYTSGRTVTAEIPGYAEAEFIERETGGQFDPDEIQRAIEAFAA